MTPRRDLIGTGRHPVVIVDDASGNVPAIVDMAAALAPFPKGPNPHYPGVRRVIEESDPAAFGYVRDLLVATAPFIAGGFDLDAFDLLEASFSMVTAAPATLSAAQRAPHFDSTDPNYIAVLHYLTDTPGTAFYRQRSTGIEAVTPETYDRFVTTVRAEGAGDGYIVTDDERFERIGSVEGKTDRLVIYQGRLLHSGIIPLGAVLSADPRIGRLTTNIFIRGR